MGTIVTEPPSAVAQRVRRVFLGDTAATLADRAPGCVGGGDLATCLWMSLGVWWPCCNPVWGVAGGCLVRHIDPSTPPIDVVLAALAFLACPSLMLYGMDEAAELGEPT
jgi:hypothetical protein